MKFTEKAKTIASKIKTGMNNKRVGRITKMVVVPTTFLAMLICPLLSIVVGNAGDEQTSIVVSTDGGVETTTTTDISTTGTLIEESETTSTTTTVETTTMTTTTTTTTTTTVDSTTTTTESEVVTTTRATTTTKKPTTSTTTATTTETIPSDTSVGSEQETTTDTEEVVSSGLKDVPISDDLNKYIYDKAAAYGVPYEFVLAVIRLESNFNPNARSSTNCIGLMQLAARYNSDINLYDPYQNVNRGISILKDCYKKAGGNLYMTYTYYNCGLYCGRTSPVKIAYTVYNYYQGYLNQ